MLTKPAFRKDKTSFCSLPGIIYYLSKPIFVETIKTLGSVIPAGSTIVFDYSDENTHTAHAGERTKKQLALAGGAGEKMLASYSYNALERLLADNGFLIYEHLTPDDVIERYFTRYNIANPNQVITAFDNVNYCLAVKK